MLLWAVLAFRQHLPISIKLLSSCVIAQFLGLGGIDSTNSALNNEHGPGIRAAVGGAAFRQHRPLQIKISRAT